MALVLALVPGVIAQEEADPGEVVGAAAKAVSEKGSYTFVVTIEPKFPKTATGIGLGRHVGLIPAETLKGPLGLADEQVAKIGEINKEALAEIQEYVAKFRTDGRPAQEQIREDIRNMTEKNQAKFREVLTDEQKKKYDAYLFARDTVTIKGTFGEGTLVAKLGDTEMVCRDGKAVFRAGDEWKTADALDGNRDVAILRELKMPHEQLGGFTGKVRDLVKAERKKGGCTFEGALTEECLKALCESSAPACLGTLGEMSGTGKFYLNTDGLVDKYKAKLTMKIAFGGEGAGEIEVKVKRTVELGEFGTAAIEIPEGAAEKLGE
jgi:hypothetical protein